MLLVGPRKNEPIEQRHISGAWRGTHNGSTEATSRLNKVVDPLSYCIAGEVGSLHVGPVAHRGHTTVPLSHVKGSRCLNKGYVYSNNLPKLNNIGRERSGYQIFSYRVIRVIENSGNKFQYLNYAYLELVPEISST
jgi:hypothetical protein